MFDFTLGAHTKGFSATKSISNTFRCLENSANVATAVKRSIDGDNVEVVIENQNGGLIMKPRFAGLITNMIKVNAVGGVIAGYFQSKQIKVKIAAKTSKWKFDKIHKNRKNNIIAKTRSILESGIIKQTIKTPKGKTSSKRN
jgi:hypothetical protein